MTSQNRRARTRSFALQIDAWREVTDSGSPAQALSEPEQPPERIGRFEVSGEIARGGVGIVFRGVDATIGRDVALKVLRHGHDKDERLARRLLEEGRIGGQLQHPGIVPVYELGALDGDRPYVAMKVVEGRTLAELLRARPAPMHELQRFLAIFEQVCQAIAFAHARGVIHRDLKPHNLMVGSFGEVQVMDWGLAKVVGVQSSADDAAEATPIASADLVAAPGPLTDALSMAGSVLGTPAYMAPEQARGELALLDARTDVFGLGAILCEILTGRPPYAGRSTGEVLRKAREASLDEALDRLRSSEADAEVVQIAERCLAPEQDTRPSDAGVVARELRGHFDSTQERARRAELAAAAERARAAGERKARRITTVFGAFVILALLGGGGLWIALDRAARERARAVETRVAAR